MSIEEMWAITFIVIAVLTSWFWLPLLIIVLLAFVFLFGLTIWTFIMIGYDKMKRLINRK